jgi:7-carboxy-7-deazaguanine synthase
MDMVEAQDQMLTDRKGRPLHDLRVSVTDRCNFRCGYCMPREIFGDSHEFLPRQEILTFEEITRVVRLFVGLGVRKVRLTGGEPLLQPGAHELMRRLADAGKEVLLETGGHRDITGVDPRVRRIVDLKAPGSGESGRNRWENVADLRASDNIKVVVADRTDFDWTMKVIEEHGITDRCAVFLSPVHGELEPAELAAWMLENGTLARLQLQLHKLLWPAAMRGV